MQRPARIGLFGRSSLALRMLAVVAALIVVNVVAYFGAAIHDPFAWRPQDWAMFLELPSRLASGELYDLGSGYYFVWSPLAAYLIVPFLWLGFPVWFALHVAALSFLRDPKIIAVALLSVPFWADAALGNTMTFAVVAGFVALRGSRTGSLVFLALCIVMPRPIQLPLAIWLLSRDRSLWMPAALLLAGALAVAVVSGYLVDWLSVLVPFGERTAVGMGNLSPTYWVGTIWLVVGVPLSAWLAWRGHLGLAGLSLSPYIYTQYPLVLLWEWPRARVTDARPSGSLERLATGPSPASCRRPLRRHPTDTTDRGTNSPSQP